MKWNKVILFIIVCLLFPKVSFSEFSTPSTMNDYVVQVVKSYPTDGTHKYSWPKKGQDGKDPYDGVTQDIYYPEQTNHDFYQECIVLHGDGKSSAYCCGLTLEVFLKAMDKYKLAHARGGAGVGIFRPEDYYMFSPIKGLDTTNFSHFKYLWFCPTSKSAGPGEALTTFGMGTMVTNWNQAQFGDFVQIWRWNGSGHSMIFVDWVKDSTGAIIGMKYWSAQGSTNGIGYHTEYFGDSKGIDRKRTFICRVTDPSTWN